MSRAWEQVTYTLEAVHFSRVSFGTRSKYHRENASRATVVRTSSDFWNHGAGDLLSRLPLISKVLQSPRFNTGQLARRNGLYVYDTVIIPHEYKLYLLYNLKPPAL